MGVLRHFIWTKFLKQPLDSLPEEGFPPTGYRNFWETIRHWYFDQKRMWYELYDFIEFLGGLPYNQKTQDYLVKCVNNELEDENAGYRFVNGKFAPITNETELRTVRDAVKPPTTALKPVAMHIQQALDLLSDKVNPDYRNSMKESISAVEALCKMVAKMPNTTLGPALDKTAKELDLNDHLRDGLKSIYKYTSDDHGIRHGLKDEEHPEQEDARFMLVTCSAFVNFVTEKARKLGKLPS